MPTSITHLPHQGYLIRTQPNNQLQATKHAEFIIRHGSKRVFILAIQAPFAEPTRKYLTDTLTPKGVTVVGSLIYDKDKTSYRSEVDQALRAKPDLLYLNGYAPDVAVVLRDLYRAGYDGDRFCQSYALTAKSLEELPKEVTQGVYTVQPSADVDLPAYAAAAKRLGYCDPGFLRGAGDRLDQHRGTDHRQGWRSDRHRDPRHGPQDHQQRRDEGIYGRRWAGGAEAGEGDQVLRRQRAMHVHRHRRHLRLQVSLQPVRERSVQVPRSLVAGMLTDIAQLVLNGVMSGAILAAPAIGFTAIYAVLRFPNFAVASHATIGAFAGYCANVWLGLPLLPAAAVAFVAAGMVGVASDTLVLRPLRPAGLITTTIASVALTIALENLVRLGFGNALRNYDLPIMRDWRFIGIRVGPQQLEDLAISVVAVAALFGFLTFTRLGKAMRAVADNPTLAAIKGIDADQIAASSTSSRWDSPVSAACCSGSTRRSIR